MPQQQKKINTVKKVARNPKTRNIKGPKKVMRVLRVQTISASAGVKKHTIKKQQQLKSQNNKKPNKPAVKYHRLSRPSPKKPTSLANIPNISGKSKPKPQPINTNPFAPCGSWELGRIKRIQELTRQKNYLIKVLAELERGPYGFRLIRNRIVY